MLPGLTPFVPGGEQAETTKLTLKGTGYVVYDAANFYLTYGNLISGAAPVSGDLVVYHVLVGRNGGFTTVYDLTSSGWTQDINNGTTSNVQASVFLAKVVTAADLTSPGPLLVNSNNLGALGIWLAFSVEGPEPSIAVPYHDAQWQNNPTAFSGRTINSTGIGANDVAVSIAAVKGTNAITPSLGGASVDADTSSRSLPSSGGSARQLANVTEGGISISASASTPSGYQNMFQVGYVRITPVTAVRPKKFRYLRWNVFAPKSGSQLQASEFRVYNKSAVNILAGLDVYARNGGTLFGDGQTINLTDGSTSTKWGQNGTTSEMFWNLGSAHALDYYTWYTANDEANRDPYKWTLKGSADGTVWWPLDDQSAGYTVTSSRQSLAYTHSF